MLKLKQTLQAFARHTILSPPRVRYCSQTVYEALLGCCRMWEASKQQPWKDRANHLLEILIAIQQPDGGFDIGYDFNFGRLHKKGQPTSPELVGLVAYCEYARLFGEESVAQPARRAALWIKRHALDMGNGKVAIPYSPNTINQVMVYNGTSFACGALGCYEGQFGSNEFNPIYQGMVKYLDSVMTLDDAFPGRFWYYCDQSLKDISVLMRSKIDYYHQMQQVEMHALAQQVSPLDRQLKIIQDAADHVAALHEQRRPIPYANNPLFFKNQVHLWGLSSVISGMLEAAVVLPDRSECYHQVAKDILDWIVKYAWNGYYFEATLQPDGSHIEASRYMVRSDAWAFNALAAAFKHFHAGPWGDIPEICYKKMESLDFSGPETHASNARLRLAWAIAGPLRRLVKSTEENSLTRC